MVHYHLPVRMEVESWALDVDLDSDLARPERRDPDREWCYGRELLFAIESNVAHEIFEFQAVFVPTDHVGY